MPRIRVVLADDEDSYLDAYGPYLEDIGFQVTTVKDKDGLLREGPTADVLVVDACLPSDEQMEGIEAVAELIGDGRVCQGVPVIFISGYRADTPKVRDKLRSLPMLKERCRWVWKDDEFEILGDTIRDESKRLNAAASS
jgi:CheY-like chemotaxis protein